MQLVKVMYVYFCPVTDRCVNDIFIKYTHSKENTSEGNDQFIKTIFFRLSKVVNQHTELEHSPKPFTNRLVEVCSKGVL